MAERIFSFHYTLTNDKGEVLDSSREGDPLQFLEGRQQIIPGLEAELCRMLLGQKKSVFVAAADAYGPVMEELKVTVNRSQLPPGEVQVGTQFSGANEGPVFSVTRIEGEMIHLDGNHPLAGMDLTFDVELTEVREATADELQHGHAHGPDGHHH